jgi:hypothetical protein
MPRPRFRHVVSPLDTLAVSPSFRHSVIMAKRKTTVYLDDELLRGARVVAARSGKKDSEVFEEALRAYLGMATLEATWSRSDLTEDEALALAYREIHDR